MIYLVDPIYNPNFQSEITSSTPLAPGITIAKFLGSRGSRVQFEQLDVDKQLVARQLYLQAEAMRTVFTNKTFKKNRLIVSEGVYKPSSTETVTSRSINDYKQTGRAIVYQLLAENGKIDFENTFELAVYWKDFLKYQELILDYDTYDPSGELSCQIVLVMPEANYNFDLNYTKNLKTTFNGVTLSINEVVEVLIPI
jgi:hypothetical protein